MSNVGLVVIGRNEGERLRRCLQSALGQVAAIVYVDSGSTDGSLDLAQALGVTGLSLDLTLPFTAARARNAGWQHLHQRYPHLEFVQFIDGDCEIVPGWLATAQQALMSSPNLAVVCGRRREQFPQQSIYNRLCDLEWDTPVGEATACGGDAMMRLQALQQVAGFNASLIAGEEPELCVRLRQQDWRIARLPAEMTRHDARMTQFRQWWQRSRRAGYAYAQGAWLQGRSPQRHWVRESRSIWFWGLGLPLGILGLSLPSHGWSLLLGLAYPLLVYRIYRRWRPRSADAALYALFCTLGKFAQVQGQLQFHLSRLLGRQQRLIEYKSPETTETL